MTDAVPTAVTYDGLPASSGGAHSLGRMTRRAAHEATMSFLRTCTEPMGRMEYSFTVHDVPELKPARHLERELEHRFGRGRVVVLDEDEVPEALNYLDDIHPQPTNQWNMAPVWFRATAKCRLLDPQTGEPLRGQNDQLFHLVGYNNELRLILDNRARLGITFCIPDADAQVLSKMLPWLQQHLPCKLSPKQWRSWTPTKTGTLKARVLDVSGLT